jgi:hypothetical protein
MITLDHWKGQIADYSLAGDFGAGQISTVFVWPNHPCENGGLKLTPVPNPAIFSCSPLRLI